MERITAATDFSNWLNEKMILFWNDLAKPKIWLNLTPNPL